MGILSFFIRNQQDVMTLSPGWHESLSGSELLSKEHRKDLLKRIKRELSVTESVWQACYLQLFTQWASIVQLLPASEAHHHAFPGGLLDHSLECALNALRLRRGYVLPVNEVIENNSLKSDRYSYAICVCSLMHDCGKLLTDIDIVFGDPDKYVSWSPWSGALPEGLHYAFRFRLGRKHGQHEWAGATLLPLVVPEVGLKWLQEDKDLIVLLFAQMSGRQSQAGAIGEIVRKSDKASVSRALGGSTKTNTSSSEARQSQNNIALHEQLIMAIRYLFHEGRLTINKPGAAAWVIGDTAWLVSKATIEAASTHLFSEGIRTVPKNVARVFDILMEHGVVNKTEDDKAVWKCKVYDEDRDWHQELTMLKFNVSTIWPNETPANFKGTVTPVQTGRSKKPKEHQQPSNCSQSRNNEVHIDTRDEVPLYPADDSLTRVMPDENEPPPYPFEDMTVQMEPADSEPLTKNSTLAKPKIPAKKTPNKQVGEDFVAWVKAGVADKSIKINDRKALVHVVDGKVLLVSPAIFQRYVRNPTVQIKLVSMPGNKSDDRKVQSGLQKLFLHAKPEGGGNLVKCEVRGDRKASTISGYLIKDSSVIFGEVPVPTNNPHLKLIS